VRFVVNYLNSIMQPESSVLAVVVVAVTTYAIRLIVDLRTAISTFI